MSDIIITYQMYSRNRALEPATTMWSQAVIKNVKGSFRVCCISNILIQLADQQNIEYVRHHNFVVIRDRFVYIAFPKTGFINVTGVKNCESFQSAVEHFCQMFLVDQDSASESKIDNITATGKASEDGLNLQALYTKIREMSRSSSLTVRFNPHRFPAIYVKSTNLSGTFILFASGSYNILGVKTIQDLELIQSAVCAIIIGGSTEAL